MAMTTREAGRPRSPATAEQVDAVMQAAHALAGITAQSVAEVEDRVTLPQLRVLILISEDASLNLSTLALALGVHPSNATRACDRLVTAGLLQRADSPADRRNLAGPARGAVRQQRAQRRRPGHGIRVPRQPVRLAHPDRILAVR